MAYDRDTIPRDDEQTRGLTCRGGRENTMDLINKKRIVAGSVVLLVWSGFLVAGFACFDYGALRAGAAVLLALIFGSPFLLKFLVPKAVAVLAPGPIPNVPVDAVDRQRILRRIQYGKIWIGILVILFPFGIADCAVQRAWVPMVCGGGMSLFMMYGSFREVRRLQKRLVG